MMRTLPGLLAAALLLAGCASSAQPAGPATQPAGLSSPAQTAAAPPDPARPQVEVRAATLPELPAAPIPPVRLTYEAIGADLPIDAVGVATDGQMDIPADALRAGWYRHGAAATDDVGAVVVAAHAGSFITPRGPLYDLRDASPGDLVSLMDAAGTSTAYEVREVEQLGKTTIDWARYFDRAGPRRLVLITCGGRWDADRQSYEDNIIVTAYPVS